MQLLRIQARKFTRINVEATICPPSVVMEFLGVNKYADAPHLRGDVGHRRMGSRKSFSYFFGV